MAGGRLISPLQARRPGTGGLQSTAAKPLARKALRGTSARMVGVGRADL